MPRRKSSPEGLFEGTTGGRFFFKMIIEQFFATEVPINNILGEEGGFWQNRASVGELVFVEVSTTDKGLKRIKSLGVTQVSPEIFARAERTQEQAEKEREDLFKSFVRSASEAAKNASKEEIENTIVEKSEGKVSTTKFDEFLKDFNEERGI